ncbi:MAG: alpha/beta hydrolase [Gammaproteobacteria bacterium]|nr:alpha/beta hydrolase [Gammaproteobacteria bacterium]
MFTDFESADLPVTHGFIHARISGEGPPVLLLHGYPQTHAIWHRVAPRIAAAGFTVVVADLPGYGRSSVPPLDDINAFTKRAMAHSLVEAMASHGFETFTVVGHDRGARVAYRMALDHPGHVQRLITLDVMPTIETFEGLGRPGGIAAYHWYFLAQPFPLPEKLIGADPEWFLRWSIQSWAGYKEAFSGEAMADYISSFSQPDRLRASCNDYRAGATLDCEIDAADRAAGRKISCPMLALWGAGVGKRAIEGRILDTWKRWANDVHGEGLPCGHFIPEEAPEELITRLIPFLRGS